MKPIAATPPVRERPGKAGNDQGLNGTWPTSSDAKNGNAQPAHAMRQPSERAGPDGIYANRAPWDAFRCFVRQFFLLLAFERNWPIRVGRPRGFRLARYNTL